jgi:hypothetical protein
MVMAACSHLDGGVQPNVGIGPTVGQYQFWTKDGRGQRRAVPQVGDRSQDEGHRSQDEVVVATRRLP